ncbi:MAG TPA: rod shape-determining protein MreD [Dehalococcoidia bacterium]|nr:rod shape-determining protein MreD [Dehalococcoidia bacterium]
MSYYIGVPLMFVLAAAEAAVLPQFRVSGLQPNLVLVVLVAWLMLRGPAEGFLLITVGGLLLGLVDGAPLGTALLALAPLFVLHEARGSQLREGGLILTIVFTVIMTATYHLIYLAVFTVQGQNGDWLEAFIRIVLPTVFINVVLLMPVYFLLSLSSQELRRASYA